MLGVVSRVHLGRWRPCGKLAISRAPCTSARCGRALRVDLVSRMGCARPGSVPGWAGCWAAAGRATVEPS
jgi:hypothetical protein